MNLGAIWGASFGTLAEFGMHVYEDVMVPRMFEPCGNLLLDEAGFVDVDVTPHALPVQFESGAEQSSRRSR